MAETALPPALRTAGRKVREWTEERDQLIREAVAAGHSLRTVAAAANLSHSAIARIVKR